MKKIFSVLVLSLFVSSTTYAWAAIGHRIVGEIAQRHLSAKAKNKLEKIAARESLADMANWPDFVRSDASYNYAVTWHYVSIPDGMTYEESPKEAKGDVIVAIGRMIQNIKDKTLSNDEKLKSLRFLVHFVGDIHQPLHVGRAEDRGGNSIKVQWFNEATNLHHVWDESLIEMQKLSYTEYANMLDKEDRKITDRWANDDVLVWAKESYDLRTQAYDVGDGKLGYDYNFKNIKALNRRLLQAGIRLAAVLNKNL